MRNGILRSSKGGYSKIDVLTKLDAYMSLMTAMKNGTSSAEAKEQLDKIRQMPLNMEPKDKEGFAKDDTDAYFATMEGSIINYFKK